MATKEIKSKQIADLTERFSKAKAVVLTEYKGLTVAEISELRKQLKEAGADYKVAKNTLSIIASRGTPVESAKDFFTGPTGIAFGFEDPVAAAKKVLEYSGKNEKLKVKSGIIDGKLCTVEEVKAISKLPARPVLLGMLAGTFQAPASKMARLLNATVVRFAYALEAVKNKKGEAA
ncbi:MAG: 50S ribosomal protein L10 [Nitrospirae bacterium]|nr:50S ribosomal protein L10 [Nitrospirota bacterium]